MNKSTSCCIVAGEGEGRNVFQYWYKNVNKGAIIFTGRGCHWCTDLFMCDTVHIRRYNAKSHWKVQGHNSTPEKRLESLMFVYDCRSSIFFSVPLLHVAKYSGTPIDLCKKTCPPPLCVPRDGQMGYHNFLCMLMGDQKNWTVEIEKGVSDILVDFEFGMDFLRFP